MDMTTNNIVKIILIGLAIAGIVYIFRVYSKKQSMTTSGEVDKFFVCPEGEELDPTNGLCHPIPKHAESEHATAEEAHMAKAEGFVGGMYNVQPSEQMGANEVYHSFLSNENAGEFGLAGNQYPTDCFPKDQLTPAELLPGDASSKWAQSVPAGQGELGDQNFLTAGYHIGVNTVGQTLRNANRQLRSEPPNPQVKVSPWLQTTIEPDTNRRPLEIGGCQ